MRSILVYILINCAFIGSFAGYDRKPPEKHYTTLTNEYFEEEAKKDIENVLSATKNAKHQSFEDRYDELPQILNPFTSKTIIPQPQVILNNIGEIIKFVQKQKYAAIPVMHHRFKQMYLRGENKSDSIDPVDTNRLVKVIKKLAVSGKALRNAKDSGYSGKYSFDDNDLKYAVGDAVEHPEDRAVLRISEDKSNVEIHEATDDDGKTDSDNINDENEATESEIHNNDEKKILKSISRNLEAIYKLSNKLKHLLSIHNAKRNQLISKKLADLRGDSKLFGLENEHHNRKRLIHMLRELNKKERASLKGNLRNLLRTSTYEDKQQPIIGRSGDTRSSPGKRFKRSAITQAGYTQDPDTCKTYNENLAQLWSNLSKYINVTEQPNDKALHNIAIIIQAYLEHQNAKQSPDTYKVKHESRDKIGDVIFKIRKMLDKEEATAEKIAMAISKNLKPYYGNSEDEDCEQTNEEFLRMSIGLLYKNYLENIVECPGDEDAIARNGDSSLRKQHGRDMLMKKPPSVNDNTPEMDTILTDDEVYNDYHNSRIPRQRAKANKNRKKFKRILRNRKLISINRSENQKGDDSDKTQLRSKIARKFTAKKLKKPLKTDIVRTKCQKYAIRKIIISLRPVIERFMGLQECQVDNTMRSLNLDKFQKDHYYLDGSKLKTEDSHHRTKIIGRSKSTRKNTGQNISKSRLELLKNRHTGHDNNILRHDIKFANPSPTWVRKYRLSRLTNIDSPTPTIANLIDSQESQSDNIKAIYHEENTNDNEYFQSPPLYNDYDVTYKAHHTNVFPSMVNPLISLNNDDNRMSVRAKVTNNVWNSSGKEQKEDENDSYYGEKYPDTPDLSEKNIVLSYTEDPSIDLDNLRKDDHTIEAKSRVHANKYESIVDFLKKARDTSLQTPEFAMPFALNTNKGYVELTHLVKYPKILVYRPQFIVKNTVPYDDFLKIMSSFNMTTDAARIMKIVRHLPDNRVQVLFESGDFESPFEVQDLGKNRRSNPSESLKAYPLQNDKDASNENTREEFASKSAFALRDDADEMIDQLDRRGSKEDLSSRSDSISKSYTFLTSEPKPPPIVIRSPMFTSLPNLGSIVSSSISGFDTIKRVSSGLSSGSKLVSSLDSIKGLGSVLNSVAGSKIGSGTASQDSQSQSSYKAVPIINSFLSGAKPLSSILSDSFASQTPINGTHTEKMSWWKTLKSKFLMEIKKILGKMDSFGEKIQNLTKGVA